MGRPCQRRRESAAAQRKSKPNTKPAGPPPIRHKARQKAIHNARHDRGRGGRGGRPSRNQRSGNELEANADFISFASTGNNFNVLNSAGSRQHPIALDEDDSLEDGQITDEGSDDDSGSDSDMEDAGALTINVQVQQGNRGRAGRATAMYSLSEAMVVYRELHAAGFPLTRTMNAKRYGREEEEIHRRIEASQPVPSTSTATSRASTSRPQGQDTARDYIFDWGAHTGKPFKDVPENYLRTIAGNPILLDKHRGIKEAFDFHRPGMRRTGPPQRQQAAAKHLPVQAPTRQTRQQGSRGPPKVSWTNFKLPSGAHVGKKLNEVPENYLRTIEGMDHVMNKWVGLKDALHDFNTRTGRQGKVAG
ncbi:hypothetical protein FB567DRAFT_499298 [Paraphoma chrysanthemicola]|uniref:Uncharacterized protein n=1 Tax=Paraphoma chrysanthemicola TaxID=798071 RepID=A0A8K0R1X5_9PLEO|nr:hypothetical protein FB567DRAFT_499298 [Paraphoma chrysanthemicola]